MNAEVNDYIALKMYEARHMDYLKRAKMYHLAHLKPVVVKRIRRAVRKARLQLASSYAS